MLTCTSVAAVRTSARPSRSLEELEYTWEVDVRDSICVSMLE